MWAAARTLRLVDGPDEVHLGTISRATIKAVRPTTVPSTASSGKGSTDRIKSGSAHPGVGHSRL